MPVDSDRPSSHRRLSLALAAIALVLVTACSSTGTSGLARTSSSTGASTSASASIAIGTSSLAASSSEKGASTPTCSAPSGNPADTKVAEPSAPHGLFVLAGAQPLPQSPLGLSIQQYLVHNPLVCGGTVFVNWNRVDKRVFD
jgi:hypothetical protein